MTPQAFSYPTVANNGMIYCAPYGLTESIDFMLKFDPNNYTVTKIKLDVDNSKEKWQRGIVVGTKIYWLPYNEKSILVLDTKDDSIEHIDIGVSGTGKYIQGHLYKNRLIALPYGEHNEYNYVLDLLLTDNTFQLHKLNVPVKDTKRWHTTQLVDSIIYGMPRGENHDSLFPYRIEYDCFDSSYSLIDLSIHWNEYDKDRTCNKKFTTLAKVGNKLYAPPYSESKYFDVLAIKDNEWKYVKTNQQQTSRKYFAHTVATNGKIYFPPAGHDEDWSEMLVVDSDDNNWYTIDLGIGKESKKYFAGVENSRGKIYYIPRGGCVCEPEETWKSQGDLAEILVIDSNTDKHYTIDIGEYFKDSTTIEKYNNCVIKDDVIYAFPYGESDSFQTVLIFDTIKEQVIKTVDLNDI